MRVSEEDRQVMARQAAALREIEVPADAQITGERRRELLEWVNRRRHAKGLPNLVNDEDEVPELGFHRLAAARGMLR